MEIEEILERVKAYAENSKDDWNLNSLREFILSFESNTQEANEEIAKNYGNIIKNLVREIMMKDVIIMPNDDRGEQIVEEILKDNQLFSMFNKLYTLILKSEKQKVK